MGGVSENSGRAQAVTEAYIKLEVLSGPLQCKASLQGKNFGGWLLFRTECGKGLAFHVSKKSYIVAP